MSGSCRTLPPGPTVEARSRGIEQRQAGLAPEDPKVGEGTGQVRSHKPSALAWHTAQSGDRPLVRQAFAIQRQASCGTRGDIRPRSVVMVNCSCAQAVLQGQSTSWALHRFGHKHMEHLVPSDSIRPAHLAFAPHISAETRKPWGESRVSGANGRDRHQGIRMFAPDLNAPTGRPQLHGW